VKIDKLADGRYRIRYYVAGHGSPERQRTFDRKRDAERFAAELVRRKQMGELALFEQQNRTVAELAQAWWKKYAKPNLAAWTLKKYARLLDSHNVPRLGACGFGRPPPKLLPTSVRSSRQPAWDGIRCGSPS
jgi:hypothetical protein